MSEIKEIRIEDEREDIKNKVEEYWSERADSFFMQKKHEILHPKYERWTREIYSCITEEIERVRAGESVKVLDIGCGAGFFEIMFARAGFSVSGIDLTPEMVSHTNEMAEYFGVEKYAHASVMDAESLDFDDESFDVIVSRNVTWTLPHPLVAYKEWMRVLKKGGKLINLDAEYAKGAHKYNQNENLAHRDLSKDMNEKCHKIYHMLSISSFVRPKWDEEVLRGLGFSEVNVDPDFGNEFYMPDRMFRIVAKK